MTFDELNICQKVKCEYEHWSGIEREDVNSETDRRWERQEKTFAFLSQMRTLNENRGLHLSLHDELYYYLRAYIIGIYYVNIDNTLKWEQLQQYQY